MLMDLCYTVMTELIIWSSVYSHSSEMEKKHNNKKKKTWPQLLYGELNLDLNALSLYESEYWGRLSIIQY